MEGEHLSVDGSFIAANAEPVQPHPAGAVSGSCAGETHHPRVFNRTRATEPDRRADPSTGPGLDDRFRFHVCDQGILAAELGYFNNYLIDNQSGVIVGVQATAARLSQESVAAREMITRSAERRGCFPQSVAADTTYGNGELLAWLEQRGITPYIRVKESPAPKTNLYGIEKFTYVAETNSYQCPEGKRLTYVGINAINRTHVMWPRGSAVATARKKRNAPGATIGRSRSMSTNQRDNGHESG